MSAPSDATLIVADIPFGTKGLFLSDDRRRAIDTLSQELLTEVGGSFSNSEGYCAAVSSEMYARIGSPKGLGVYSVLAGTGDEHVVLYDRVSGYILDPTGSQFSMPTIGKKWTTSYTGFLKLKTAEIRAGREEFSTYKSKRWGK